MILKIVGIVLLCLLLLLLFYPLGFRFSFSNAEGSFAGKVVLRPFLFLKRFGIMLYDSEKPPKEEKKKKEKVKKEKKKRKKAENTEEKDKGKEKKRKTEWKPVTEMILSIVKILGKTKRGTKHLWVRLSFTYGFPDPALTGELTGAIYAALPPLFGDMRHCRWRVGIYPVWCPENTAIDFRGEIRLNVFLLLFAYGGVIPELLKLIPKKKKKTEVEK